MTSLFKKKARIAENTPSPSGSPSRVRSISVPADEIETKARSLSVSSLDGRSTTPKPVDFNALESRSKSSGPVIAGRHQLMRAAAAAANQGNISQAGPSNSARASITPPLVLVNDLADNILQDEHASWTPIAANGPANLSLSSGLAHDGTGPSNLDASRTDSNDQGTPRPQQSRMEPVDLMKGTRDNIERTADLDHDGTALDGSDASYSEPQALQYDSPPIPISARSANFVQDFRQHTNSLPPTRRESEISLVESEHRDSPSLDQNHSLDGRDRAVSTRERSRSISAMGSLKIRRTKSSKEAGLRPVTAAKSSIAAGLAHAHTLSALGSVGPLNANALSSGARSARSGTATSLSNTFDARSMTGSLMSFVDGETDDGSTADNGFDTSSITGFAIASYRRNADFHALFPHVPAEDQLIEDFACALQKDILKQGRLYISERHLCFYANIFGWITSITLPFNQISNIRRKMTALVIPNAIHIHTRNAKHVFASFLSRDTTFDILQHIWKLERPINLSISPTDSGAGSPECEQFSLDSPAFAMEEQKTAVEKEVSKNPFKHVQTKITSAPVDQNYAEVVMDCVFPATPEKMYNLIFTSGFLRDFMAEQKLWDIEISEWAPEASGSKLLSRTYSYMKPLNGSIGPRQTKCYIKDESTHIDFEDYISLLTTTRTPDVPSGGIFAAKTRTCITWAGRNSCRVLITSGMEWSGRSFVKAIIDRSAMDGQRQYNQALERALKVFILQHKSEFLPEGETAEGFEESHAVETKQINRHEKRGSMHSPRVPGSATLSSKRHSEDASAILAGGPLDVCIDILHMLVETLHDIVKQLSGIVATPSISTTMKIIIGFLLFTNFLTLSSLSEARRRYISAEQIAYGHVLSAGMHSATGQQGSGGASSSGGFLGTRFGSMTGTAFEPPTSLRDLVREQVRAMLTGGDDEGQQAVDKLSNADELGEIRREMAALQLRLNEVGGN